LVVYVASQMASTLYMSATVDKTQRILFMVMPLVFVFVIARFPAGLVLYWVTTNLWTVGQGLITRRLIPKTAAPLLEKRTSRTPPRGGTDGGGEDGGGNGAVRPPDQPKPAAPRAQQPPRRVRRKKKAGRR
jgi:YidC/Oxa1 family membrane protein insertase